MFQAEVPLAHGRLLPRWSGLQPRLLLAALLVAGCTSVSGQTVPTAPPVPEPEAVIRVDPATTTTTTPPATTTTSPPTTTSTVPPRERLVVRATGDVNLDPDYIPAFRREGYGHGWSGVGDLFLTDDLTIVNLECAAAQGGSPAPKEFVFRCDPAALPVMAEAGVEVANLANNHSQDYGAAALVDSVENLRAAGIAPVGAGRNLEEAIRPALFELKGWRVAVVGLGGVVPAPHWLAGPDRPGMADGDDAASMAAVVRAAAREADLVVVTIHWGVELDTGPRADDVERAEAMIAAGADAIFGHHPHRLQPLEWVEGRPVAWSLGNFVWPSLSVAGSTAAVAEVVFEPDGTVEACLRPVFIESHGHPVLDDPDRCDPPAGKP